MNVQEPSPTSPEKSDAPDITRRPLAVRLLHLGLWVFGLWFFFAILTPRLEALCPAWRSFIAAQDEYGLHSGAVYYTDVPVTQEAEAHVREAVRKGMEARRAKRERERQTPTEARPDDSRHTRGGDES